MKDKIFIFIVGFLIGAIITASGLLIYQKVNNKNNAVQKEERIQMMHRPEGQELPEMPNGDKEPPSKDENQENRKEPPTKQNGVNNSNKQDTKSSNDSKTTNKE